MKCNSSNAIHRMPQAEVIPQGDMSFEEYAKANQSLVEWFLKNEKDVRYLVDTSSFIPCREEATEVIYCPTWITAIPHHFCEEHAKNFKEEFNPNAKGGEFYFGDEAQTKFEESVREINRGGFAK